jgi:hypothetical protein
MHRIIDPYPRACRISCIASCAYWFILFGQWFAFFFFNIFLFSYFSCCFESILAGLHEVDNKSTSIGCFSIFDIFSSDIKLLIEWQV